MTDLDLDRLRALADAATDGEWAVFEDVAPGAAAEGAGVLDPDLPTAGFEVRAIHADQPFPDGGSATTVIAPDVLTEADAAFIAAARTAVPALLARLTAAEEEARRLRGDLAAARGGDYEAVSRRTSELTVEASRLRSEARRIEAAVIEWTTRAEKAEADLARFRAALTDTIRTAIRDALEAR